MVTAILPSMISPCKESDSANLLSKTPVAGNCQDISPSVSSELTATPQRPHPQSSPRSSPNDPSPTRLAGIVGIFTGCGALLALGLFLRLPEIIQRRGTSLGQALTDSYYIVGALSLILAVSCFIGLRNLHGEDEKGWRNLVYGGPDDTRSSISNLKSLTDAVALGFKNPLLGLGYLGGFVARASVRPFRVIPSSTPQIICLTYLSWAYTGLFLNFGFIALGGNANSGLCSRLRSRSSYLYS